MVERAPETVTQFCARVLGLLPCEPPVPKRGPRYAAHPRCWLCGGATRGVGWPQAAAITPTFTQHNTAACQDSDAVCQGCAALTRAASYQAMVRARGLPIKLWTQAGWHSYSHHIREDGHYEAPTPARMREILLSPPAGRWVMAINTTGQKHTLFRGAVADVADGRTPFPVQVDEETLWVHRDEFAACLADFERLSALGCGKDGIETGRYHQADLMRAGLARWHPAEVAMARWRERDPSLVALVRLVARSARAMQELGLAAEPPPPPQPAPSRRRAAAIPAQGSLL